VPGAIAIGLAAELLTKAIPSVVPAPDPRAALKAILSLVQDTGPAAASEPDPRPVLAMVGPVVPNRLDSILLL
jgi:hypothetical protein